MKDGIATHNLKLESKYFGDVVNGVKSFEIRQNDRDFNVGDYIILKRYDPKTGYVKLVDDSLVKTDSDGADNVKVKISYITDYAQKDNYIVMSIVLEK